MKKHLITFVLLGCAVQGFPQARKLLGLQPTTNMPGYIYYDTLRNQYLAHPLVAINDSTIGMDTSRYYISSFAKNAARDSIVLKFINGVQFAVKDSGQSPAGSTGQIQYNTAGVFGASSNLFYDIANAKLGVGTSSPAGVVQASRSSDALEYIMMVNSNSGTSAGGRVLASNGTNSLNLIMDGLNYNAGVFNPFPNSENAARLESIGADRLIIRAYSAVGAPFFPPIQFILGDSSKREAMRIFGSKTVAINTYTDSTAALVVAGSDSTAHRGAMIIMPTIKLTTPRRGVIENDTTGGVNHLLWTDIFGNRYQIDQQSSALIRSTNASLQTDTVPLFTFGGGGGNAGDTISFTTSTIYGSFFNSLSDTLVITRMQIGLQGTSASVTVDVYWNDSLNVSAGATKLVTAGNAATNLYTGTSVTSFDNTKIPPGVWVWCKTTTVTNKPIFFNATLIGYKSRTQ